MQFLLKEYKGHKYIQYIDEESGLNTTNGEYFVFSVKSEDYKEIMKSTGGFVANMTSRLIRDQKIDIAYIMLCTIPQEYNNYLFAFIYLDENGTIITSAYDNNAYDYQYFKQKFKECIVKEGFIFDLYNDSRFNVITEKFCKSPSTDFELQINNKPITFDDTLIYSDMDIFKKDVKSKLERLDAAYIEFKLKMGHGMGFVNMQGIIFDKNNNALLDYQITSGIKDKTEYVNHMKSLYHDYDESRIYDDIYTFTISSEQALSLIHDMKLKEAS